MESSEQGCRWLRDQWAALLGLLESNQFWESHDRLKAVRLLGRQPVDAIDDLRVTEIFVASHGLHPVGKTEFDDLLSDMGDDQHERYRKTVRGRWPELFRAREASAWKQILVDLAERNIERLDAKLEVHEANVDVIAERTYDRLSFDPTNEGEALRNYELKCTNALFRGMENYRKFKARTRDGWSGLGGMERQGRGRDRSRDAGFGAPESEGPKVGPVHSFAWGDGERERLERPVDTNDLPDRAAQPRCGTGTAAVTLDATYGRDAMSEDATSEANFDENAGTTQQIDPVDVTTNTGVVSGLDKGVAQPREAEGIARKSPPEPRKVPRFMQGAAAAPGMETEEFTQCIHEPLKRATESVGAS
jgi:hypothetical protein